ncbi:hypothetical protein MASR1M97_07680 [Candidatus Desulfobacillus denitrificans]
MDAGAKHRFVRRLCAGIAVAFGAVTLFAGGRVLLGADPGYTVFRPLLVFNTAMGAAYAAAGAAIWRDLAWGRNCAGAIFLLNLLALAGIAAVRFRRRRRRRAEPRRDGLPHRRLAAAVLRPGTPGREEVDKLTPLLPDWRASAPKVSRGGTALKFLRSVSGGQAGHAKLAASEEAWTSLSGL